MRPGAAVSHISQAYPDRVEVRGRDLTGELMGRLSFTEYFHLLLTGREPTEDQRFFLDLLLVAIAEHGMMPTNVAARMTLAADPGSLQGAVAAGILGCGPVILGTAEACARLLEAAQEKVASGQAPEAVAEETAHAIRASGERLPGFGHPVHRPLDPRAERILELADARGVSGPHVLLARCIRDAATEAWGKPLTLNVSMPIAAVMLDLGFPSDRSEGRSDPGAHCGPPRSPGRGAGGSPRPAAGGESGGGDPVRAPGRRRASMILEPEVETRPWAKQPAVDDPHYRRQLAYLFERSTFYRAKLAAAGFASSEAAGGLVEIAQLPLTEKREIRATCTPENPIGSHLCVEPAEIVRIYSTSGTTGAPSYIPLTADDLENWVTGSARSYAASGVAAGQRIVSTYNAGPFVAGAALAAFDRIGLCHIPVGSGNTERLLGAIEQLKPAAAVLTPSYAAHLVDSATERKIDLREASVERVLVAGEPGGGEPAFRAELEEGWGARVTEAMGIGDIGVSLWGECEEQDGMHLGARGFVHAELIEPETGVALEMDNGASGELVLTHLQQRAAPLLRFRTRDHVQVRIEPLQLRPHEPAGSVHRAHRRHADRPRGQRLSLRRPRGGGRIQARGQRPHPRQAAGAGSQTGTASTGRRRAGPGRDAERAPGGSDPREAARGTRRPDTGRADAVGQPGAKRIQVEARRALG